MPRLCTRERLIEDHEHVFTDIFGGASKARQRTFRRFADRIWIANHMRLNRLFQKCAPLPACSQSCLRLLDAAC